MAVSDQQKVHPMRCKNPCSAPQPGWVAPNNSGDPHIIYTGFQGQRWDHVRQEYEGRELMFKYTQVGGE